MKSLYWVIRYFYAKKHCDFLHVLISEYKPLKTPLLLKLLNCKLLEVRYHSDNEHSFTGVRWLIVGKDRKIEIPSKTLSVRISGDDTKSSSPMVIWECNV